MNRGAKMFEIPKHKVLKAYNEINDACLDCQSKDCDDCLIEMAKGNLLDFSKYNSRLDDKFAKEDFSAYDYQDFAKIAKPRLEEIYDIVHECCAKCGVYHTEKCFINNTREALQLLIYGEIIEWDGIGFKK